MENMIVLLNTILAVISILLFVLITFKEKELNDKIDHCGEQSSENIYPNNISMTDGKAIIDGIAKLELEILKLRKENSEMAQRYKESNLPVNEDNVGNNNFRQILNYNFFKEKNGAVIDLYRQGKSEGEIAKVLNKSIREVEMVVNLVK